MTSARTSDCLTLPHLPNDATSITTAIVVVILVAVALVVVTVIVIVVATATVFSQTRPGTGRT